MGEPRSRVVVVEDETAVRDAVVEALRHDGLAAFPYADYADEDVILGTAPDVAVLDVILPHGDGFELARRLRARRDLPVIFLTARDAVSSCLLRYDVGARPTPGSKCRWRTGLPSRLRRGK